MDVTLATSVDEFFHEVVTDALSVVDLEASEPASWYLVGLLGEMTRARLTDEPLGVKLAQPGSRSRRAGARRSSRSATRRSTSPASSPSR